MNSLLLKLNNKLFKTPKLSDTLSFHDAESFFNQLDKKHENDLFGRSIKQYKGYCSYQNKFTLKLIDIVSIIICPLIIIYLRFVHSTGSDENIDPKPVAVAYLPIALVPQSLLNHFEVIHASNGLHLDRSDLNFVHQLIKRCWRYPFLILKVLIKIAHYSKATKKNNANTIISKTEFSFTSSILTAYCHFKGLNHYNAMHGEKIFSIRDSYCCFDRFYVWEREYINLFKKLRACSNQFVVEIPSSYSKFKELPSSKNDIFKYYLNGQESKEEIELLIKLLKNLSNKFYKVIVRPHPRYTKKSTVNILSRRDIDVEHLSVSIANSIQEGSYICAKFSTVLYQGYLANRKVVIDDVLDNKEFEEFKHRGYIMFSKTHKRLSDIINESA